MDKNILIEVFKSKACTDGEPQNWGNGSFSFSIPNGNSIFSTTVDIRILGEKGKYYIRYENIKFEITEKEHEELRVVYQKKKTEKDEIEREKDRMLYEKNSNDILAIYRNSITQNRKVLLEKIA
jgi:hypothetical protein